MANDIFKKLIEKEVAKSFDPVEQQRLRARDCFWEYCKLINPKFFKDSRPHLKNIADTLQALYEGRIIKFSELDEWKIVSFEDIAYAVSKGLSFFTCKKLMMNIPPRHAKSYTVTLFVQWMMGKDNENRVITVSYNETLSGRFSTGVRDGIDSTKIDASINIFSDVFPNTKIKAGDSSKQIWALDGQFFNYLGAGFGGTITGIGCRIGIIDDPIKNAEEANNDRVLENQWSWYTDTYLSRIEEGGIQIVIMTRWSTKDLCGRLQENEPDEWYVLCMKACLNEEAGLMLCPELLSFKSYTAKKRLTSPAIMEANFQQMPVDVKGRLYNDFQTYTGELEFDKIISYTDTADEGADFLVCWVAGIVGDELYVLDALYTDKAMEYTEPATAEMLNRNKVNEAIIESNNGGRGFARNVEQLLKKKYNNRKTLITWFHQGRNKKARILSNATLVMQRVFFPVGWESRWPELYRALISYQSKGKNDHDDAPDALTGLVEVAVGDVKGRGKFSFANKRVLGLHF